MSNLDIRWKQRFSSYQKALAQLTEFIDKGNLNKLEKQGLIKAFEYTYELAWNVLKEYLEYQGIQDMTGSRDAVRAAFKTGLIEDGDGWMQMIKDRNKTSHTYNEEIAKEIATNITERFFALFVELSDQMQAKQTDDSTEETL